jgi:ATP-binding cassette subfamily B protein
MTVSSLSPAPAEFSIESNWQSDRRDPIRWLASHAWRYRIHFIGLFIGAFGNGMGAGLVFMHIGWGFDAIVKEGDVVKLGWIALSLVVSQIIRGVLMLWRNFSSEIIGQRVERDTRDELYVSLIWSAKVCRSTTIRPWAI